MACTLRASRSVRERGGLLLRVLLLCAAVMGRAPAEDEVVAGFGYFPPLSYPGPDGQPTGFVVDVIGEAARREGIALNWRRYPGSAEEALRSGDIHLIAAGMLTAERKRNFHVTRPWWISELQLVTLDASSIRSFEDTAGRRIGVLDSPPAEALAERLLPSTVRVATPWHGPAFTGLCQGQWDAIFLDCLLVQWHLLRRVPVCSAAEFRTISVPQAALPLALVSDRRHAGIADRLRGRIDDLALDGTLERLAVNHPLVRASGVQSLTDAAQARYDRNLLLYGLAGAALLLVLGAVLAGHLRSGIARRKKAAEALRKSEERLAQAQRIAALGNWSSDFRTGRLEWSDEIYRIFGVERGGFQPTREKFYEAVHPEDRERVRTAAEEAVHTGRMYHLDHRIVRPDRSVRYVREQGESVRDAAGNATGLAGALQDITDYKQLEQQLLQAQKLECVGRLAGGIAHDFNNLLTIINGYTSLVLERMSERDALRVKISEIRRAGERAAKLVEQLLAFSRRQVVTPKPLDISAEISGTKSMIERLMGDDVRLITDLASDAGKILADPSQLQQVLLNLAINARDAMPSGGTLTIRTAAVTFDQSAAAGYPEAGPGAYVELSVSDTGSGMDRETQQKIFEPFFTTKERGAASGLGLSTVYGIVKQWGGSIRVESAPGEGATFKMLLPRTDAAVPEEPAREPASPGRPAGRVLVVDDEGGVRRFLRDVLAAEGYQVWEALHGKHALVLLREQAAAADLVIMDLLMPEKEGIETIRQLRQTHPRLKIIAISGALPTSYLHAASLLGAEATLSKPIAPDRLVATVKQVLG